MIKKILKLRSHFTNWYLRIFERLGLVQGDITYRLREYPLRFTFKATAGASPAWILEDMLYNDSYNDAAFMPSETPVVIDVGANIGTFAVLQAAKWPAAKVYAYEAHGTNYGYLKKNVEQNNLEDRVQVFHRAVFGAPATDTVKIYEHDSDAGSNSLHITKEGFSSGAYQEAQTVALSEIITTHNIELVDVLKMDVEGAEYEILRNSTAVLEKVRFITMEYHKIEGESAADLKSFLEEQGFVVTEPRSHIWHCKNKRYF